MWMKTNNRKAPAFRHGLVVGDEGGGAGVDGRGGAAGDAGGGAGCPVVIADASSGSR